jgi:hypothetical protein
MSPVIHASFVCGSQVVLSRAGAVISVALALSYGFFAVHLNVSQWQCAVRAAAVVTNWISMDIYAPHGHFPFVLMRFVQFYRSRMKALRAGTVANRGIRT